MKIRFFGIPEYITENIIKFARDWLNDKYILYRVELKYISDEWKNIKVNKTQTFDDQCKQGRRPRINWFSLYPQICSYCKIIFNGSFYDLI